ncbi:dihydrofolate reductase family protein [Actinophytocola glycyrrhizae]|uniref:Dihydrofolate reductase family protein n=1 Tax=Actinophytocola glycyrrhizae TaxID=2044873 RepID=A0ABV9RZ30_9PSEU
MSTIAINMFLTLDGVAQSPGAPDEDRASGFEHGGWQVPHFSRQLGEEIVGPWHANPGALLLGRKTYDIFAGYWPHIGPDHDDYPMAKIFNETPKYVASRSLTTAEWTNTTVLSGDLVAAVTDLKARDLGEIQVIGSLDLAQTLIRHRLVDEFRLTVFPVVLGTGKRLFDGAAPTGLELVSAQPVDKGVVACVYRPTGAPEYGTFGV